MNSFEGDILREKQLQMVGRLLAGFSHQLKNHLAVIKESNGLLGDMLDMGQVENKVVQDRLQKIVETVGNRLEKTAEMAKHLSGFAHRNDAPLSPFHLQDILDEDLAFLRRFAELKSLDVALSFGQGLPMLSSNPALVQFIFSSLFLFLLSTLSSGGTISVFTEQRNGAICVGLRPEGLAADGGSTLDDLDSDQALQTALKYIGANVSIQSADGRIRTILFLIPHFHASHCASPI